eukprot:COSAG05_NODE_8512_length_697_cov_0.966555_2_plen_72_part_00
MQAVVRWVRTACRGRHGHQGIQRRALHPVVLRIGIPRRRGIEQHINGRVLSPTLTAIGVAAAHVSTHDHRG